MQCFFIIYFTTEHSNNGGGWGGGGGGGGTYINIRLFDTLERKEPRNRASFLGSTERRSIAHGMTLSWRRCFVVRI